LSQAAIALLLLGALIGSTGAGSPHADSPSPILAGPALPAEASTDQLAPDFMEHLFGPTDINAALGNGRLAVGISRKGTVTVAKWPRPSFHDQVRYLTISRRLPRLGARVNDGVFFGLLWDDPPGVVWLRDFEQIRQEYLFADANVLQTTYTSPEAGLEVEVTDFVAPAADVLVRRASVRLIAEEKPPPASLLAFANLALCQRKLPYAPVADWLLDAGDRNRLRYDSEHDLLVQDGAAQGPHVDRVAAAFGFWTASNGRQCGQDGLASTGGQEAYRDAADGQLSSSTEAAGSVDAAISAPLQFDRSGVASVDFLLVLGPDATTVIEAAADLRASSAEELQTTTARVHQQWLEPSCLPDSDDPDLTAVAQRALLLIPVVRDSASGAIGCSVATQPPYALDWSRDGSFVNLMLDWAGYRQWATDHNLFYARTQRAPLGNWDMCVYGDGAPGGPIFLELDTLALTAWSLWNHFSFLEGPAADAYLNEVYGAIAKAADFFLHWRDPATGLPLPAFESDFPIIRSTLLSAEMAWLAMRVAIEAGETAGESPEVLGAWAARENELETAIYACYFDSASQQFIGDPYALAYLIYPVEFLPVESDLVQTTAEGLAGWLAPIMRGETAGGSYLGLVTLALARAWAERPEKWDELETALGFLTRKITTEGTRHYGEVFVTLEHGFAPRTGIPHPMTAALTVLTAGEMYGWSCPPAADDDAAPDDDGADDDTADDDAASGSNGHGDQSESGCGC
jgi:hypothetical protein